MENEQTDADGTAEPVSRDQSLRRERGQENIPSLCSADHEQVWQPYPVDPYSDDFTYIHTTVPVHTAVPVHMYCMYVSHIQQEYGSTG